jgi:peroxiredoxin
MDKAPDFALQDQDGITRTLDDYTGKWVVLYFYPKDDTPGCTTEACNFRDVTNAVTLPSSAMRSWWASAKTPYDHTKSLPKNTT